MLTTTQHKIDSLSKDGRQPERHMKTPVLFLLVSVGSLHAETPVSFVRDVMPILNKAGCAQGTKLDVEPSELLIPKPGESQQIAVTAHYADGATRIVTQEALYSSNTPTVADINGTGLIKTERKGEAAMLVRYEGKLAVLNVTVLTEKQGFQWKPMQESNYIDKFINAKLQRIKILPSEPATDAEFLRRVSYDLAGAPPTVEELKAFLADKNPAKRSRAI